MGKNLALLTIMLALTSTVIGRPFLLSSATGRDAIGGMATETTATSSSTLVFSFQNITSNVLGCCVFAWVAQSIYAANSKFAGHLTVGGNGLSLYSASGTISPPNLAGSGFLTGAAWDGEEFLLVGQHYSPAGGVIMFKYNPLANSATDLSSLFNSSLNTNATLLETVWTGSVFYILGLKGEEGAPGFPPPAFVSVRLFTYNPGTHVLTDHSSLLPSSFATIVPYFPTIAPQEMAWTPFGLFLLFQTSTGAIFGVLNQQTFTDITSLLPPGFFLSSFAGDSLARPRAGYILTWNGSSLFIAGELSQNVVALLSYNPSSNQMTNYSSLLSQQGTPLTIGYSNGLLYVSGFRGLAPPTTPLLTIFDSATSAVNDISAEVPSTAFESVMGLAVNAQDVFIAGGRFNNIQYGLACSTSLSIKRGTTITCPITLTSVNGFSGKVSLTTTIAPVGFKSPSIALSATSFTLSAGGTATSVLTISAVHSPKGDGAYVITVTATSGSIIQAITINLSVIKT